MTRLIRLTLGAIFIKPLREKLKLRENVDTELLQNQKTLQFLIIMVGCRSNSVSVYVKYFFKSKKTHHQILGEINEISLFSLVLYEYEHRCLGLVRSTCIGKMY